MTFEFHADAASILDLLMLAASQGTELVLSATGPEAEKALEAVASLFDSKIDLADCHQLHSSLGLGRCAADRTECPDDGRASQGRLIGELLTQNGGQMGSHLAVAVRQFDEDISGIDNAFAAVAMLDGLEKAA